MDVILHLADEYLLDTVWAKLVPLPLPLSSIADAASTLAKPVVDANSTTGSSWLASFAAALPTSLQPPSPQLLTSSLPVSAWPRDYFLRQLLSISALTMFGIMSLYFVVATFSYYFIFDHRMMKHPRFLKDQVLLEIQCSMAAFPGMGLLTIPWFMAEVRGHTQLYEKVDGVYGWAYMILSVPLFLLFTDYCIYWIHRWLHIPVIYKHIHKPHHKWIIPTPFASHAFHPVDGYTQSLPYHIFIYLFPMQRYLYLGMFVGVNFWSIFIHDSDMVVSPNSTVEKYINTPAHHTLHHIYFTCNYGQYFTWADRAGGSYRAPESELDPLLEVLAAEKASRSLKTE